MSVTKQQNSLEARPEIVIGLVAKIGTDIDQVQTSLSEELDEYGYETIIVKVSGLLNHRKVKGIKLPQIVTSPFEEYCGTSMDACNRLRELTSNSIMAELAIDAIRSLRTKSDKLLLKKPRAFIVRQLKRREEVEFLRNLYGDRFILMSTYCPARHRKEKLAEKIAISHGSLTNRDFYAPAEELIKRDEDEAGVDNGQNVRDVFPLADVILDGKSLQLISKTVERFFSAFFGNPLSSPSNDEYGAHIAFCAGLRSIDLSRKVGVAVFSDCLEILAMGCNEVPKFGGGTYLHDEVAANENDGRDAARGFDANSRMKSLMAQDAAKTTFDFVEDLLKLDLDQRNSFEKALANGPISENQHLKKMMVLDIGEFGRAVHAEMNAITDAARSNHSLKNAVLYSTTFPCHNCAKHIVAAGIIRVVYLQPYPKSKVDELYPDSIDINPTEKTTNKVIFEVLTGIAPNAFSRIFGDSRKRKNSDGTVVKWRKSNAIPIISSLRQGYLFDEKLAINLAFEKLSNC